MDQLIRQLERKIASLVEELATAKKDIETLRKQLDVVISSENHEIPDAKDAPATDQLQIYIDDSLDLSISSSTVSKATPKKQENTDQLSFDLPFNSPSEEHN